MEATRVGLVTGGAQGIGLGIAKALASLGVTTIIVDLQEGKAAEAADDLKRSGGQAASFSADVSDAESVQALFKKVQEKFGAVDILCNNAGIVGFQDGRKVGILETPPEVWDQVVSVNLRSVYLMSRAFAPAMIEKRWGRIINTASAAGRTFIKHSPAVYTASKAAVVAVTWTLADEFGPFGITVNSLAPGRIDTPLGATIKRDTSGYDHIPLRRPGTPDDIGRVVKFLASDDAEYITGTTIDVGGGLFMA